MEVTELGMVREVNASQSWKADFPIWERLGGRERLFSLVQFWKRLSGMADKLEGRVAEVRLEQSAKANFSRMIMVSGRVTVGMLEQR